MQVSENVNIGHVVGSVTQTNSDDEQNLISTNNICHITYTLTSLMSDSIAGAFDIDRITGSLVVARELDREAQSEYRLEVRALDTSAMNNPQSSATTVRVDIIDVNDNSPRWLQDPITIPINENTEVGTAVHNFTAFDADSDNNGELRYSLVKEYPKSNSFVIDYLTGTLILSSALDYEMIQEYTLIVKATDQALNTSERLSTTVTARIVVTDANDNVPKFVVPSTSTAFLSESTGVGMMVTHIVAVDSDSGDNGRVTYVISSGNELNIFALGYDTGILTLAKPLVQNQKMYVLNITATDHGTPTRHSSMELKLVVKGNTESPPKFLKTNFQATVSEDVPVGTFITKIETNYHDLSENMTFFIPSGMAEDTFEIISPSGRVLLKKSLDRETQDEYLFPIYVTDSSANSVTVFDLTTLLVRVTDVNDHTPEFQPGVCYRLSIPENSDTSIIHTVIAKDSDIGPNGNIMYSITNGNIGNKFNINMKSGELSARPLDRETQSRYQLTITAQDKGSPSLQSSCNITIFVEDQNDNDPKFDSNKYETEINEDIPVDTSLLKVYASDQDVGVNGKIIYSLSNETQWLFRIDNKTGIITTAG